MKGQKTYDSFYEQRDILGRGYTPLKSSRFSEIPTFLRAPQCSDLSQIDVGIIGIPYDGGLTCRTGARHGPREVRNQSTLMRAINVATGARPFEQARIADLGDVRFQDLFNLEQALADIEQYYGAICQNEVVPLGVGGDHSITYPILKAISQARNEKLAVIHIDAHTDTWGEYQGSKFHHGAPFRIAADQGLIDPQKVIQIGIRGGQNFTDGLDYSREKGMRVMTIEEFDDIGWAEAARETIRVVGNAPVYLSFDVDGLDPVYAPGTGTPEAGGISMREAQRLLRAFDGSNFVGGDVVEVSPPLDPSGLTALNAATILFEMLCLVVNSVVQKK